MDPHSRAPKKKNHHKKPADGNVGTFSRFPGRFASLFGVPSKQGPHRELLSDKALTHFGLQYLRAAAVLA